MDSLINENLISGVKDRCRECGCCIRSCPVKAVMVSDRLVKIIDDRCVHCGICAGQCSPGAINFRSDVDQVKRLVAEGDVIAIISSEFSASFHHLDLKDMETALLSVGFFGIEDSVIGDEIIAGEYLKLMCDSGNRPLIRSTCPVIVELTEKYRPDLLDNLAPIVSPMIAQGRFIKTLYDNRLKTVFIGPCVAKKFEAERYVDRPIDAVLTFSELKSLLDIDDIRPEKKTTPYERPLLMRSLSVSEGFPRQILEDRKLIDNSFMIGRGLQESYRLLNSLNVSDSMPRVIDLMACRGCIDGPGMCDSEPFESRISHVVGDYQKRLNNGVTFDQIRPMLPPLDTSGSFIDKRTVYKLPSEEELATILKEGRKSKRSDELDCGSCGYDTCRQKATAIYQGLADWSMCFPLQRKVFIESTDKLKAMSATDGLTGLLNHRAFLEKLKEETQRVKRYRSLLSLIMIDVDKFKPINDLFGHLEGDRILKLIANILVSNLRETDYAARYGGDEFSIILPETNKTEAFAVAEKLRRITEETVFFIGEDHSEKIENITLSLGICVITENEAEPQFVISKADKAMYQAKEMGRNSTVVSD